MNCQRGQSAQTQSFGLHEDDTLSSPGTSQTWTGNNICLVIAESMNCPLGKDQLHTSLSSVTQQDFNTSLEHFTETFSSAIFTGWHSGLPVLVRFIWQVDVDTCSEVTTNCTLEKKNRDYVSLITELGRFQHKIKSFVTFCSAILSFINICQRKWNIKADGSCTVALLQAATLVNIYIKLTGETASMEERVSLSPWFTMMSVCVFACPWVRVENGVCCNWETSELVNVVAFRRK